MIQNELEEELQLSNVNYLHFIKQNRLTFCSFSVKL